MSRKQNSKRKSRKPMRIRKSPKLLRKSRRNFKANYRMNALTGPNEIAQIIINKKCGTPDECKELKRSLPDDIRGKVMQIIAKETIKKAFGNSIVDKEVSSKVSSSKVRKSRKPKSLKNKNSKFKKSFKQRKSARFGGFMDWWKTFYSDKEIGDYITAIEKAINELETSFKKDKKILVFKAHDIDLEQHLKHLESKITSKNHVDLRTRVSSMRKTLNSIYKLSNDRI